MADDIAQGSAVNARTRFFLAAAHAGEMARDAVAGAQEKMAGADSLVADFESKQSLLGE